MNEDLKKEIKDKLLNKFGRVNADVIRMSSFLNSDLYRKILSATSQFDKTDLTIGKRIKLILNVVQYVERKIKSNQWQWVDFKNMK